MAKCKCSPSCKFKADETGYHLFHDPNPTPERAEQRRKELAERGTAGSAKRLENRDRRVRRACSLRSVADLLAELERALLLIEESGGDKVQRAVSIVKVISEARTILLGDAERSLERLQKLLAEHPELSKRIGPSLAAVK